MPDVRRVRAVVAGRVQGVGFRWFAVRAAERHGVGGWVRNLADGSVEVEAEGPPAAVEAYMAEVRRGPPAGRVEAVRVEEVPPRGDIAFDIRY